MTTNALTTSAHVCVCVCVSNGAEQEYQHAESWRVVEQMMYNTILAALSRAGRFEEALLLLKEMETRGIERDAVSYACAINA